MALSIHNTALRGLMTVVLICKLPGEAKCFSLVHHLLPVANFPPVSSFFLHKKTALFATRMCKAWVTSMATEGRLEACCFCRRGGGCSPFQQLPLCIFSNFWKKRSNSSDYPRLFPWFSVPALSHS